MTEASKPVNPTVTKAKRLRLWLRSPACKCTLLFLGAAAALLVLFFSVISPRKYDLHVGTISHVNINATKDVVDEVTTEERRQAAGNAVEPTYHFQEGVKEEVLSSLAVAFSELRTVQQYGRTLREEDETTTFQTYGEEEIDYAMELVENLSFSRYQITTLMRTDTASFDDMVTTVTTAVENSLNTTIREGQLSQSIQTILQIVGYRLDVSLTQNILPTVLRSCVKPNMVIDQEATQEARQKAMDAVEPAMYLQGQNVIRVGDKISRGQYETVRALGLLSDESYDYSMLYGAILIVFLSVLILWMLVYLLCKPILTDARRLSVILLVIFLSVALAAVSHLLPSLYIAPVTLGSILITVLVNYRAGICVTIPLGLLISGVSAGSSSATFYDLVLLLLTTLAGGIASLWLLKGHPQRVRVLLSGFVSGVINAAMIFAIRLLSTSDTLNLPYIVPWAFAGNVLSGVLAFALQPMFESLFRLPTPSKLLELTNPNQPLMKRLLIEAPGTYHHSIIVANLAESAAEKIGANAYLARAGAYYHDIGKLKRPAYFKENQVGDNPHDKTDPYVSAAILTSHTHDGYLMAQKERLPVEVQDIILQHHGVTPVMFFYHKALQMSNGSQVDIDEFRYDGPRPQTREAAIVMLADTIEAAVRSMKDPTPKAIDQFIERLVRGKLEDGQLSDSPLTLRDIDQICEAFSAILKGVFHERIEYPAVRHTVAQNQQMAAAAAQAAPEHAAKEGTAPAPQAGASPVKETPKDAVQESTSDKSAPAAPPKETAAVPAAQLKEAVPAQAPQQKEAAAPENWPK